MAARLASVPAAVLHRAQLLHTSLGELVHVVFCLLHPVDCCFLLHHGVDGERPEETDREKQSDRDIDTVAVITYSAKACNILLIMCY